MKKELKIKNIFGEKLDVLIEGNENANEIIIFVHGFGTDKNEGFNLHKDIAQELKNDFLIIRFDQSGYGDSGGLTEEFHAKKGAGDLNSIIQYARENYSNKKINICAHSLGTFVVSLLAPENIYKTVFTGVVNLDLKIISEKIKNRIIKLGGKIDKNGVMIYPRTSGEVQRIGKKFWEVLENSDLLELLKQFSKKTNLLICRPMQDEIVGTEKMDEYKNIKTLKYIKINGDHNFSKYEDRKNLIEQIKKFLTK